MQQSDEWSGSELLMGALAGAAAGALAVWVMDRVDWTAYRHEAEQTRAKTVAARPEGMDPAHVLANTFANRVGKDVKQPSVAGIGTHYAIGILPGALYGMLHDRVPGLSAGRGGLFGLGLFLLQDELFNTITGLSGKPRQYPWQAHARGAGAHLVYGLTTDAALRLFKRMLGR
ncbi:DUF1440 domain-containing protein [Stutzerimonas urumqiensis]|uniref:hypothetical protein n=1 Tax=Stutzerimonas urumqiensis TaxID=638269 RepID=UPI003BA8A4D0